MTGLPDVHVIRLREPWERVDSNQQAEQAELETAAAGTIRFQRRFGMPTNLQPTDHVDLVLESTTAPGTISLNGTALGIFACNPRTIAFVVQAHLRPRNLLQMDFHIPDLHQKPDFGDLVRQVRLEIRSRAGLDGSQRQQGQAGH